VTSSARATILVSRFPGSITPGALPILPDAVTIHDRHGGGFILYRWFDDGAEHLEQAAPEFHETLADAWLRVPAGYVATPCPEDFARMAFRRPTTTNERTA
jgi:hypothetical protein